MAEEYRLSYTGQQVDEAIGKALTGLPTITIAVSQVISQNPVRVQLTSEQYTAMNERSVIFDLSAFDMSVVIADYAGTYTDDNDNEYLNFVFINNGAPHDEMFQFKRIFVNVSTKVAELGTAYPQYADQVGEASLANRATFADEATSVEYSTTAPSSANTNNLKIVVLSSEPATRYAGYLYIITGSN